MSEERRRHPRYELLAQVRVKRSQSDLVVSMQNISATGALLDLGSLSQPSWIDIGRVIDIAVVHPDTLDAVDVQAKVVRIIREVGSTRFAVDFENVETTDGLADLIAHARRRTPAVAKASAAPSEVVRAAGLATLLIGCTPAAPAGVPDAPTTACTYHVTLSSPMLEVHARCDGNKVRGFVASESVMAHHVNMRAGDQRIPQDGANFVLPSDATADVIYNLNLDAIARDSNNIDVAYKSGDAWVTAASTWLLRPFPAADTMPINVVVHAPDGEFATGLRRHNGAFTLTAGEVRHATYGVFGKLEHDSFTLRGSTIDVITAAGPVSAERAARTKWVRDAAEAVAAFWGRFPVERATVVLIPTSGHSDIAHGKVVATGGATVAIHFGSDATVADLYRDWILVHELFHLGFPSFLGEGKWLDEGLATYYEPIIRARAGWRTPRSVWRELAEDMPQGLHAIHNTGLENAGAKGVYWGGAIVALLADVRARQRTGRTLQHGLRAVLAAGGDASQIWPLARAIDTCDQHIGAPILGELHGAYASHGGPLDLSRLLQDLGVNYKDGAVSFNDEAPLASIREAILPTR